MESGRVVRGALAVHPRYLCPSPPWQQTSKPNHQRQYHGLPHPHMAPKTRNRPSCQTAHRRGHEMVHRPRVPRRQPSGRPHHRRSGYQHTTTPTHESPTPQPSHHSHQNRRSHRRSLGNHRRFQIPNPYSHPQRRSQKRHMERNRPHHSNLDNPPEHTKTGQEHRVPLNTGAIAVLATAHRRSSSNGLVFSSPTGRTLSNATMSKLCKDNNVGCVPHGMRSSFRDWCGETGVSREVAEQALGHEIRNAVEKAYARTDLLERRRQIMEKWSRYLDI